MDSQLLSKEDRLFVQWVAELADELQPIGDECDRTGQYASVQIERLKACGFSAMTVPERYGGRGASLYQMLLALERLAQGDGASALILGWHLGITLSLGDTEAWPADVFADFCEQVLAGKALVNACGTEPETGSPSRGGRPTTTARAIAGGYVINGRKTWATGSPSMTHILVRAWVPEQDLVGEFLVLQGTPGVTIEETWDSMSMRASGSHTFHFRDVFVPDHRAMDIGDPGHTVLRNRDGGGWLLHIPATYMGVANRAREYALHIARTYAPSSLGKPIGTVAHVREKLGQIEVLRMSARTVLYDTAKRYEALPIAERMSMRPELGVAKYVVTNAALEMIDLAMRIVGGNSLLRDSPLERCYRDVRAGLHNPPMDDMTLLMLADLALAGNAHA